MARIKDCCGSVNNPIASPSAFVVGAGGVQSFTLTLLNSLGGSNINNVPVRIQLFNDIGNQIAGYTFREGDDLSVKKPISDTYNNWSIFGPFFTGVLSDNQQLGFNLDDYGDWLVDNKKILEDEVRDLSLCFRTVDQLNEKISENLDNCLVLSFEYKLVDLQSSISTSYVGTTNNGLLGENDFNLSLLRDNVGVNTNDHQLFIRASNSSGEIANATYNVLDDLSSVPSVSDNNWSMLGFNLAFPIGSIIQDGLNTKFFKRDWAYYARWQSLGNDYAGIDKGDDLTFEVRLIWNGSTSNLSSSTMPKNYSVIQIQTEGVSSGTFGAGNGQKTGIYVRETVDDAPLTQVYNSMVQNAELNYNNSGFSAFNPYIMGTFQGIGARTYIQPYTTNRNRWHVRGNSNHSLFGDVYPLDSILFNFSPMFAEQDTTHIQVNIIRQLINVLGIDELGNGSGGVDLDLQNARIFNKNASAPFEINNAFLKISNSPGDDPLVSGTDLPNTSFPTTTSNITNSINFAHTFASEGVYRILFETNFTNGLLCKGETQIGVISF